MMRFLRSLLIAFALSVAGFVQAYAQSFSAMHSLGYQALSSLSSATSLTVPAGTMEAFIICTGQTVNWRDDGTAPTSSVGMPLPVLVPFPYTGANLSRMQLIQTSASAACNVMYYGF